MQTIRRFMAVGALAVAFCAPSAVRAQGGTNGELWHRMVQLNSGVTSYTATAHVDVSMKSFPFLSPSLEGTVYYKKPDKQAVVFNTVPALASAFKKVYPNLPPPSRWADEYNVAQESDDGTTTLFRLTKKKEGRVDHLDVKVDDKTATPTQFTFTYKDGGYVSFDQQYEAVGNGYLVKSQTGHVELPSYKADVQTAFTGYKLNVPIQDRVFQQ